MALIGKTIHSPRIAAGLTPPPATGLQLPLGMPEENKDDSPNCIITTGKTKVVREKQVVNPILPINKAFPAPKKKFTTLVVSFPKAVPTVRHI